MTAASRQDPLFLCLDQGGHASRALVFDSLGRLLLESRSPLLPDRPDVDRVEYPADTLLDSLRESIADALTRLGERAAGISAAGLVTQRANVVCWDRQDGQALGPVLSWQDRRNARWLEQFADQADWIHRQTGLPLSPHYGASKLRWCLDNLSAVQQARQADRLLLGPMAAWLVARLTVAGQAQTDPVNASRTQLWSLEQQDWDERLLELFGIPRKLLPSCTHTVADFGQLQAAPEIPLRLVSGDQSAALFAYGPLRMDTAYVNLGTGAFVSRPGGSRMSFDSGLLSSVVLQDADHTEYVLEGTVNGAGAALDWLARQHDREMLAPAQLAEWLDVEQTDVPLFLNGVSGLAAPYWRADFDTRFVGAGNLSQQAVAVVESIVFLLQTNLARMEQQLGAVQRLQVTGGLAHLDGLCQRLADLVQVPVFRPSECEASARGCAYLLAGQPASWPEPGEADRFTPRERPDLRQRYGDWLQAMQRALN